MDKIQICCPKNQKFNMHPEWSNSKFAVLKKKNYALRMTKLQFLQSKKKIRLRMAKSRNCTQNGQESKLHSEWPKVEIRLRMDKSPN